MARKGSRVAAWFCALLLIGLFLFSTSLFCLHLYHVYGLMNSNAFKISGTVTWHKIPNANGGSSSSNDHHHLVDHDEARDDDGTADDDSLHSVETAAGDPTHAKWKKYPNRLFRYLNDADNATATGEEAASGHCPHCFHTISWHPRVVVFPNLLSGEEADSLIAIGKSSLVRSGVVGGGPNRARTSQGTRLPLNNKLVKAIDLRIVDAVNGYAPKAERKFKSGNSERLYLLRYEGNERYTGHPDHFGGIDGPIMKAFRKKNREKEHHGDFEDDEPDSHHDGDAAGKSGPKKKTKLDRAVTILVYLKDLPEGMGATSFPYSSRSHPKTTDAAKLAAQLRQIDSKKGNPCDPKGPYISITPKRGMAVMFYDLYENGVADPYSLHSGCPVNRSSTTGSSVGHHKARKADVEHEEDDDDGHDNKPIKWLVTKWFQLPLS